VGGRARDNPINAASRRQLYVAGIIRYTTRPEEHRDRACPLDPAISLPAGRRALLINSEMHRIVRSALSVAAVNEFYAVSVGLNGSQNTTITNEYLLPGTCAQSTRCAIKRHHFHFTMTLANLQHMVILMILLLLPSETGRRAVETVECRSELKLNLNLFYRIAQLFCRLIG